ncbi:unnamed protein product [Oncorhynchus mykiss]|uniref:Uncharacterized protein n=1 Tax=Oncorhynchus mykiss TaxID=8022 RepID=A0A060W198_ONCMY|nr:unnamed protein product [Oncorhynchus mykiss]
MASAVHRQKSQVISYQKYRENLMRELLEEHHTPRRPSTGGRPAADNPLRLTAQHFPCKVPQTASQGCPGVHGTDWCLWTSRRHFMKAWTVLTKTVPIKGRETLCSEACHTSCEKTLPIF